MRVKAIIASFAEAPEDILRGGLSKQSQSFLTKGKDYIVYAICSIRNAFYDSLPLVSFCIVSDIDIPEWYPSCFFEIVDRRVPPEWEANLFGVHTFVMGPSFMVESAEDYEAMIDQELQPMELFFRYKQGVDSRGY